MANVEIKFLPWTGKASLNVEVGDDIEPRFRLKAALEIEIGKARNEGREIDLRGADLSEADLREVDLRGTDLSGAYLREAYLRGAYLYGANLREVDLRGTDLSGADLSVAYLRGAKNLPEITLRAIKADFWMILTQNTGEVPALISALREGRVDGSTYSGACACLVGTIANARNAAVSTLERDASRPAETWFLPIRPGDKPGDESEGGFRSRKALEWAQEWSDLSGAAVDRVSA